MEDLLKFGKGNAKLTKTIATFSLPSGYTCPFAKDCKSFVEIVDGHKKIVQSKDCKFRCYSASLELVFSNLYKLTRYNFDLLKNSKSMKDLIIESLKKVKEDIIRIHVSGDFFNKEYFKAWIEAINNYPNKIFYAYTKCVKYVVEEKDKIPKNFIITCSYGGKYDNLISKYNLKNVKVYFSEEEANKDNRLIDHDDSLALDPNVKEFGLLLHGMQAKNSKASLALKMMKEKGVKFSYGQSNKALQNFKKTK